MIRRVLHWKKQPYELHDVSLWQALTQVRRPNPVGKLPCLEHDGRCYELRLRLGTRETAPR